MCTQVRPCENTIHGIVTSGQSPCFSILISSSCFSAKGVILCLDGLKLHHLQLLYKLYNGVSQSEVRAKSACYRQTCPSIR